MTSVPQITPYVAVNAAIQNESGQVLVTRRSQSIREPGKWCLPGGHLEGGEAWVTALRREVNEETGLTVLGEELIGIYSDPSLTVTENTLADGKRGQFIVALFLIRDFQGQVALNDEVDAFEWVTQGTYPDPMVRSHPIRVDDAFRFNGTVFVR